MKAMNFNQNRAAISLSSSLDSSEATAGFFSSLCEELILVSLMGSSYFASSLGALALDFI
jgi:hypothetical protein